MSTVPARGVCVLASRMIWTAITGGLAGRTIYTPRQTYGTYSYYEDNQDITGCGVHANSLPIWQMASDRIYAMEVVYIAENIAHRHPASRPMAVIVAVQGKYSSMNTISDRATSGENTFSPFFAFVSIVNYSIIFLENQCFERRFKANFFNEKFFQVYFSFFCLTNTKICL